MKQKRALQFFINEENNRLAKPTLNETIAYETKVDKKFIEKNGRVRTDQEVADEMGYSLRQVQRFLSRYKGVLEKEKEK